jgi:hypothetical protein
MIHRELRRRCGQARRSPHGQAPSGVGGQCDAIKRERRIR